MKCPLCKTHNFPFLLAFCNSHKDHPLVILNNEHRTEFTEEEKKMIQEIFKGREVCYINKSIKDHAHAHILPIKNEKEN